VAAGQSLLGGPDVDVFDRQGAGFVISRSTDYLDPYLKSTRKKNEIMAKARISKPKKKTDVSAEDAAANKRFFTITGICVLVLLVIIFIWFKNS